MELRTEKILHDTVVMSTLQSEQNLQFLPPYSYNWSERIIIYAPELFSDM